MKYGDRNSSESPQPDPMWRLCCDFDEQGHRCSQPGGLTESTRGSDRWYCHVHFPPFRSRGYARTEPPAGWKESYQERQAIKEAA